MRSDCDGEAAKQIYSIACVSHESAALDECAKGVHRGQSPFRNQSDPRSPIGDMLTLIGIRSASARTKALAYAF
jgi:hypothetical protein